MLFQRKYDTECRIHLLSQAAERELHLASVRGCLGLCAHLQDELLRIERLLAADDPTLRVSQPVSGSG